MSKWLKASAAKRQDSLCLRVVSLDTVSVVWSVVVYVVCVCVCVAVCVRCGVARSKRLPFVCSKRPRVYRHHAHMLKHMCAWCRYTRGRFERTHEERFGRTHGVFQRVTHHTPNTTPTQRHTETDRERARKKTEKEEREETTRGGRKEEEREENEKTNSVLTCTRVACTCRRHSFCSFSHEKRSLEHVRSMMSKHFSRLQATPLLQIKQGLQSQEVLETATRSKKP